MDHTKLFGPRPGHMHDPTGYSMSGSSMPPAVPRGGGNGHGHGLYGCEPLIPYITQSLIDVYLATHPSVRYGAAQPLPSAVDPHVLNAGYNGYNHTTSQSVVNPIDTSRLFSDSSMSSVGTQQFLQPYGSPTSPHNMNVNGGFSGLGINFQQDASLSYLDTPLWEDYDISPNGGSSSMDEKLAADDQQATRKQRRIASERRYRERTDYAMQELVNTFRLFEEEAIPTKKTKEAQLRHAARLIK